LIPASGTRSAIISKNASKNARATRARERFPFRVLQSMVLFGLSSAGFPTGGSGCDQRFHLYPNEPASHFPQRAGHTATGRLHCCLCNFSRITHITLVRNPTGQTSPARNCDSLTITTPQQKHKPVSLWKPRYFCGKGCLKISVARVRCTLVLIIRGQSHAIAF
jgi:hypothetical protein